MTDTGPPLNENLEKVAWLLGKWRCESGNGKYPNIEDFVYGEELEFSHVGQPNLQYSAYAWNSETKKPMHREVGFLKVRPGTNQVALVVAANVGTSEVEEGQINGQSMSLESQTFSRVTFNKPPTTTKLKRTFTFKDETLIQVVDMETENTPMTEHLRAVYRKVV